MRPEGSINLNVILHEDRLVTKMLVILATEEPGDNMKKSQFGWQRDVGRDGDKAIPGTTTYTHITNTTNTITRVGANTELDGERYYA